MAMTDKEVQAFWRKEFVEKHATIDPDNSLEWHSLWVGMVTGLNRPDLSSYSAYKRLGFRIEAQVLDAEEKAKTTEKAK